MSAPGRGSGRSGNTGGPPDPKEPRRRGGAPPKPAPKERLADQTRKQLGKHYANKYRTGRRG